MSLTLAQAITQLEGTNPVYNNPGAISGTGDTGSSFGQGIGIYSDPQTGLDALNSQVSSILSGNSPLYPSSLTVQEAGSVYNTGSTTGNPTYGQQLAQLMGVSPNTTLAQLSGSGSPSSTASSLLSALNPLSGLNSALNPFANHSLEDFVTLGVGILLIAAGIFAFKTSQTVIQVAGKAASRVAEVSA